MNKNEEIKILEQENNELKHKIKDLEYENAEQQVKDEVLWDNLKCENGALKVE
jgi:cell division protein FtsB